MVDLLSSSTHQMTVVAFERRFGSWVTGWLDHGHQNVREKTSNIRQPRRDAAPVSFSNLWVVLKLFGWILAPCSEFKLRLSDAWHLERYFLPQFYILSHLVRYSCANKFEIIFRNVCALLSVMPAVAIMDLCAKSQNVINSVFLSDICKVCQHLDLVLSLFFHMIVFVWRIFYRQSTPPRCPFSILQLAHKRNTKQAWSTSSDS